MFARKGIRDLAALLLGAVLVSSPGCSDPTPADRNAGLREIFTLSDLSGQIQPVIDHVNASLEQQRTRFTAAQFEIAKQVVQEQFALEKVERRMLGILEKRTEREHVNENLEWLRTPLGKKIVEARIATYRPGSAAEMASFMEKKRANPPSQKRLELIERYDTAANLSGIASETMLLPAYGIAIMVDALEPKDERQGPKALRESVISRRALLEPIFKEMSAVTSLFAFRDLSDEEIEALVVFSESEAGKWYYGTTSTVFLQALLEITSNLGAPLIAALPAQPSS
jgi:hypothetical protein